MTYILPHELSQLLGLRPQVLARWPRELKPPMNSGAYRYDDVNAWLAAPGRAYGFAEPPTIERMVSGELTFVLGENIVDRLLQGRQVVRKAEYVMRRIRSGRLPALRLRETTWTVLAQGVERLLQYEARAAQHFGYQDVVHILGLKRTAITQLVQDKRLVARPDPADMQKLRYTRASVIQLVRELLPEQAPLGAEDWIEDRNDSQQPLMLVSAAAAALGLPTHVVKRQLLSEGKIAYIWSPNRRWFIVSPDSVDAYKSQCQPLTIQQKAAVFSAVPHDVVNWQRRGQLQCLLHTHDTHAAMFQWCMVAYLQSRVGPGVDAAAWVFNTALASRKAVVWSQPEAVKRSRLTAEQLAAAATEGRMRMVLNPRGVPVYSAADVEKEVKRYR